MGRCTSYSLDLTKVSINPKYSFVIFMKTLENGLALCEIFALVAVSWCIYTRGITD